MKSVSRCLAIALAAIALPAACATPEEASHFDRLADSRPLCDVPFEEGMIAVVSGVYSTDRYHTWRMRHPDCPDRSLSVHFSDGFEERFTRVLNIGNAIVIGAGRDVFEIDVEGRLFTSVEGPAIEFLKLGAANRIE